MDTSSNTLVYSWPLRIQLFKFSHVTTTSLHGPLPWIHVLEHPNLFVVFDQISHGNAVGSVNKRTVLRVMRGSNVLVCKDTPIK
jgi:hypothetical protein